MLDSSLEAAGPGVSIVLPTYNRAKFLPQAFASIRSQTLGDWELIVVDDGSTDTSRELVETFQSEVSQPVQYVHQANQGAYAARNVGVGRSRGRYVAFFDSDDYWLPHHLQDCVSALDANAGVDWVYGTAARIADHDTGQVITPNSCYIGGDPRPFLRLRVQQSGPLSVIDDSRAIECHILHGLYCGLQKSVLRREVCQQIPFVTRYKNLINEAEDQLFVVRALAKGFRIGYLDNIHLVYGVHSENSTAASASSSLSVDKKVKLYETMAEAYADLANEVKLTPAQSRALRKRLCQDYFWHLGYTLLWSNGRQKEALRMYRRGLAQWPYDFRCWRTYFLAPARSLVAPAAAPRS